MRIAKTVCFALALSLLLAMGSLAGCAGKATQAELGPDEGVESYVRSQSVTMPAEALRLLEEGNKRFAEGKQAVKDLGERRREHLYNGQKPFAVIVSCSDSRVPPEIVFDQGLGDVFVVRVAGNVIDPVTLGSVEYGTEHLGAPLVVVLGHQGCGAVQATVKGDRLPGTISSIASLISPAASVAKTTGVKGSQLVEVTVDKNIENSIAALERSPLIEELVAKKRLRVIGAKYLLSSGKVEFVGGKE